MKIIQLHKRRFLDIGNIALLLELNITSSTEGQEITGDLNTSFEILGATSINITSPIEGEAITGDLITSFEIII